MKTSEKKEANSMLKKSERTRLKYIAVLPSLITLINGLLGFAAIGFASRAVMADEPMVSLKLFATSGYLIFFAMIADMLDGRVARMSQSTSSFGGQLDSMCDMISFGVAPAFLMLKILNYHLHRIAMDTTLFSYTERFIWLCGGVYVACTAIRLARFNVENEEDESAHMSFMGLPSPAAAGIIASLVIFYFLLPDFADMETSFFGTAERIIIFVLPLLTLLSGVLMISRVRYPHVINHYLKGKKPFTYLIYVLVYLAMLAWNHQLVVVISFVGFAASGIFRRIYFRFSKKDDPLELETEN